MKHLFKKKKVLILFIMFILGIYISYKKLEAKKVIIDNKEIIDIIINNSFNNKNIIYEITKSKFLNNNKLSLLQEDYKESIDNKENVLQSPIIYIYNTHQTEEYKSTTIGEYSLSPTVIINNYILEDVFNKKGYKTYVEEKSIKEILNNNNWNYASSYNASRILLEEAIIKYPSLKYFIDVHRDSLDISRTKITINERDYAKILFIVGLENKNYQENLDFTERINNKLNEYYPGLSKGIYKKEGPGVNGVYNQDFSNRTILIEIGGYENTTTEVLNTSLAFSRCFYEIINEENN